MQIKLSSNGVSASYSLYIISSGFGYEENLNLWMKLTYACTDYSISSLT